MQTTDTTQRFDIESSLQVANASFDSRWDENKVKKADGKMADWASWGTTNAPGLT